MSKHRYVHVAFWQDAFVLDLTPEEKYFYLYLMTNSKTSQVGIYELPKRVVELETGYHRETVDKLLQRFIDYGKVKYCDETKEIMIINWVKHNWNPSTNVLKHVAGILEEVKNTDFVKEYLEQASNSGVSTKMIQFISPLEAPTKPLPDPMQERKRTSKEKEQYKEQEQQQEKEKETEEKIGVGVIFEKYSELGFGSVNGFTAEQINLHLEIFEPEVIIKSLEVASNNNVQKLSYVNAILNNWKNRELTTIEKVEAEEKKKMQEQYQSGPKSYSQKMRERPGEKVPDWMNEKPKNKPKTEKQLQAADDPEFAAMISEFRSK